LIPTCTVARTVPNVVASTGLLGSQVGLVGSVVAEHSGMLTMLNDPVEVPVPSFATTISLLVGTRSAHTGATPTGIVGAVESSVLVCALMAVIVLSPWFMMNARRPSPVITPYTGWCPTGKVVEIVFVPVSIAATWPTPLP